MGHTRVYSLVGKGSGYARLMDVTLNSGGLMPPIGLG